MEGCPLAQARYVNVTHLRMSNLPHQNPANTTTVPTETRS
jgi:hypothetical protein